ncbi:dystrophin-1 [Contarinia nasturtii]|uniref:dystrophin-1 n=1 Tax=Contarinia nasturtii TaxID=265458 RepID=UPI0012D4ABD4|nr:dystrophin-1 [Contarinia nasturtii]
MFDQKETASGYLFYVNRQTGKHQNNNPQLMEIMQVIHDQHKSIKYITYRCATKIWFLKQSLYTVNIPYSLVLTVLNHHGFSQCDNVPVLKPRQLIAIIHDIYYAAHKCDLFTQSIDFHLKRCTSMLTNFFWCIYDPKRMVPLSLLVFRQLMLILCNTQHYGQLIEEEFNLVTDPNRCVNRFRFDLIVNAISKFFSYIGESQSHGPHLIGAIIQECFEKSLGMIGLSEYQFIELWQKQNIKFAYYTNVLALLHRIKESQNILHDAECVNCKRSPIVGIRFKCQQCKNLSLCFECFCAGYKSSKHEMSHRMYEISTNLTKSNVFSSTFATVGKWFCLRRKPRKSDEHNLTMEIKVTDEHNGDTNTTIIECVNDTKWDTPRKPKPSIRQIDEKFNQTRKAPNPNTSSQDELQSVLNSLAHQVESFQAYLALSKKQRKLVKPEFLCEHQVFLNDVFNRLRVLNVSKPKRNSMLVSSTYYQPQSSTPYQNDYIRKPLAFSIGSQSTDTIYRSRSDKVYLDDNRSEFTLVDVSTLPRSNTQSIRTSRSVHAAVKPKIDVRRCRSVANLMPDDAFEAEMENFKHLINKIKTIVDDSNSDNNKLSTAARKFETALDKLIESEEQKRICYV